MRSLQAIFAVILLSQQCISQPIEESVVSVYTTHSTTMGTNPPLDVYHQIANNLAEKITSPIYKLLGINSTTKTETATKAFNNIELQDDTDLASKYDVKPVDNDISKVKDVEELSVEAIRRTDNKKPEKITLYSNYLPPIFKASQTSSTDSTISTSDAKNDTWNELDDPFDWDLTDKPQEKPREGPLVYFLELFGSFIQLLWGGLMTIFRPNPSTGSS